MVRPNWGFGRPLVSSPPTVFHLKHYQVGPQVGTGCLVVSLSGLTPDVGSPIRVLPPWRSLIGWSCVSSPLGCVSSSFLRISHLHTNSHQHLWKWLVINPYHLVDACLSSVYARIDGLKLVIKSHQQWFDPSIFLSQLDLRSMCLEAPLDLLLEKNIADKLSQYNVIGLEMLSITLRSGIKF